MKQWIKREIRSREEVCAVRTPCDRPALQRDLKLPADGFEWIGAYAYRRLLLHGVGEDVV